MSIRVSAYQFSKTAFPSIRPMMPPNHNRVKEYFIFPIVAVVFQLNLSICDVNIKSMHTGILTLAQLRLCSAWRSLDMVFLFIILLAEIGLHTNNNLMVFRSNNIYWIEKCVKEKDLQQFDGKRLNYCPKGHWYYVCSLWSYYSLKLRGSQKFWVQYFPFKNLVIRNFSDFESEL